MMNPSPIRSRTGKAVPKSEEGYAILVAIFLLALLVLSLAVAAPQVAKSIQRDRDLETFHRGMQYRRAIQLYYRKFHAYPPSVDALVMTNNIRFLRKKYIDPTTGKDVWTPILFGQNKTPTAMGFFGEPLAGTTIAGTGPSGGNGLGGSGLGGNGIGGSGIGGSSGIGGGASANSSTAGTSGSGGAGGGATGTGSSASGSGSGSNSGSSGQTFGGAGIIGFSPGSSRQSILVYKKKNHYNEWEFTYDPASDLKTINGGNAGSIGQPASGTTTPVGSNPLTSPGPTPTPTNTNSMPPDTTAPPPQ